LLDQQRAEELMTMPKQLTDEEPIGLPDVGGSLQRELRAIATRERFWLDIYRGRRLSVKCTYQERFGAVPLVRLDLGSRPHTNPDGATVLGPHIHTYREGYEDKWAEPVSPGIFTSTDDLETTLREFLDHCNVENVPATQRRFAL